MTDSRKGALIDRLRKQAGSLVQGNRSRDLLREAADYIDMREKQIIECQHQLITRSAVSETAGSEKAEWLIWSNEHRAWWGPRRCGYPRDIAEAGRYTLKDARNICRSRSWEVGHIPPETMIHEAEVLYAVR